MSSYYLILIWSLAAMFIASISQLKRTEVVCGEKVQRYYMFWAVIVFVPLIYFTMNRGPVADSWAYMQSFEEMPQSLGSFFSYMGTISKDKGFYGISALIKILLTNDVEKYFLILAIIQGSALMWVYRKYSINYMISFFLFIASTDYVSWMYNGIRQFTAVSLTFACTGLILKKKYLPAIIVVLLASTIHGTALLVLPFIFIAQGKAWNEKTILFILSVIVVVAFIGKFTPILDNMLQETQYKNVVSDWQNWQDNGTSPIRVIIYSLPAILSFIGLKYIKSVNDPIINLCTNMSIAAAGFYVVSMVTSGIFIGRLPIYFSLYSYILLPWEIENMFSEKGSKVIYIGMIGAYVLFYYYQIHMTWGLA